MQVAKNLCSTLPRPRTGARANEVWRLSELSIHLKGNNLFFSSEKIVPSIWHTCSNVVRRTSTKIE